MAWIAPGKFWMGCDSDSFPDATPLHEVALKGYWIDVTPVINDSFARFVRATGYKTIAEQTPKAEDFPGAPPENLVAGALVFVAPQQPVSKRSHYSWWHYAPGANWRHPEGPGSDIKGKGKHPVVQIAWANAVAYAKWAGKRLPTEAEFEYAARGGGDRKRFAWGDEFKPDGQWRANIWQGTGSPAATAASAGTAPTGAAVIENPAGPADSFDPQERSVAKRVQRGGSFLCTDQHCARYLVGA